MSGNVLIVIPHLDDESISCAGLILNRVRSGFCVDVLCVFSRTYSQNTDAELDTIKLKEQLKAYYSAASILGIKDTTFVGVTEGEPYHTGYYPLISVIEKCLAGKEYEEVVVPHKDDLNQDHRHLSDVMGIALRSYNLGNVKRVLAFHGLDGKLKEPNWFEPMTEEQFALKCKALSFYEDEVRQPPHPRAFCNMKAMAMVCGSICGLPLAEGYTLLLQR